MVSSYPSKEDKVKKRLERLQELLMGHQVTDAKFKNKGKQDSSIFQNQLEKWAKDFQILESEFSKLVQQLIRSN